MEITIKMATPKRIKKITGELFEAHGYQFCIGFTEDRLAGIELSTGQNAVCSDNYYTRDKIKYLIREKSKDQFDKAVKHAIENIENKYHYPFPLNEKVIILSNK